MPRAVIRLSAGRRDVGRQPREVLARFRRIGKDVDRLLHRDRAKLLQPAPGAHAKIGRGRGHLMDEQQPARVGADARRASLGLGPDHGCGRLS